MVSAALETPFANPRGGLDLVRLVSGRSWSDAATDDLRKPAVQENLWVLKIVPEILEAAFRFLLGFLLCNRILRLRLLELVGAR